MSLRESMAHTLRVLESLPIGIPEPSSVSSDQDGCLDLEWYRGLRRNVSVNVDCDSMIHWAGINSEDHEKGSERFCGTFPPEIAAFIRAICGVLLLIACGCGVTAPVNPTKPDEQQVQTESTYGTALAQQMELCGIKTSDGDEDVPAFKGTEVLEGMLNQADKAGIPASFVQQVREHIAIKPYRDLSQQEIDLLKGLK